MAEHGFGIIGCGMIAEFHARAISEISRGRLVAVSSRNEENAQRVAEPYSADSHSDYRQLLERDDINIINVCTPSGAHKEIACDAAAAGKHVIIEKPIEVTLERADEIIEACKKAGVKLAVVFPSRFRENSAVIRKALNEGRFGKLVLGDAYIKWYRSQDYYDSGGWRGTCKLDGGGALMNQSIHAIDLLQWFMGPVRTVQAFSQTLAHERIEVEDTAVAALQFANGALGVIEGSTAVYPGFLKKIEISGDTGSVIMEDEDILCWQFAEEHSEDEKIREKFAAKRSGGGGASDPSAIDHEGHRRQFEDMIAAIEHDTEPRVNGPEGRKAVEIILAIYESSRKRCPIELPLRT